MTKLLISDVHSQWYINHEISVNFLLVRTKADQSSICKLQ